METLIATVLIMVVFMLSSLVLNNVFANSVKNNTRRIDARIHQLEYQYLNKQLYLPYEEELLNWYITVDTEDDAGGNIIVFKAEHQRTKKVVKRKLQPR